MSLNIVPASPQVVMLAKPRLLFSLRHELPEGAEGISTSQPQPLYTATTQDILDHALAKLQRPDAWQLLVLRGEEPLATLEMRIERHPDGGEDYHYAGVMIGKYTYSIYDALSRADEIASDPSIEYELRIVRAPTVYLYAVWLHAPGSDLIIPCTPAPTPLKANEERSPDAVCEALRELAEHRLSGKYRRREG